MALIPSGAKLKAAASNNQFVVLGKSLYTLVKSVLIEALNTVAREPLVVAGVAYAAYQQAAVGNVSVESIVIAVGLALSRFLFKPVIPTLKSTTIPVATKAVVSGTPVPVVPTTVVPATSTPATPPNVVPVTSTTVEPTVP